MEKQQLLFGDPSSIAERDKENGMRAAVAHADREIDSWSDRAYAMLITFIDTRGSAEFLGEDIRIWSSRRGLPDPPCNRAWGAVIRRASIDGVIKFFGYAKTTNPKAHRTPAALWKKSDYSLKPQVALH